ncbi:FtsW/RodA/SpoVE family cell cycle protein [Francisella noatunensis]
MVRSTYWCYAHYGDYACDYFTISYAQNYGFLHPWENANGSGYQLVQALIGFGRGGWFGDGLGNGVQKQFFLPEAHTDFITSVIAEEICVVGLMVLLVVYLFMVFRAMNIAKAAFELKDIIKHFYLMG